MNSNHLLWEGRRKSTISYGLGSENFIFKKPEPKAHVTYRFGGWINTTQVVQGYSRQKYKNYFQTSKLVLEGAPSQPRITKTPMDITPSEDGLTIKKYRSLMKWKGKSTDAIIKNYLGQPKKGSVLNVTFLKKLGYLKVTFLKIREARDIL